MMAANAQEQVEVAFRIFPSIAAPSNVIRESFERTAKEMTREVKAAIDEPYPPASEPGEPPHKRTGYLQRNTQVTREGNEFILRYPLYGEFLEQGAPSINLQARPFLVPTIADRAQEWQDRIDVIVLDLLDRQKKRPGPADRPVTFQVTTIPKRAAILRVA